MSENKVKNQNPSSLESAWGHCAHIPVSPEENQDILESYHRETFVGPAKPTPKGERLPKLKSISYPPKSYSNY